MSDKFDCILVIDDEESVRMMLNAFFDRNFPDSKFVQAANGAEGFEKFEMHSPDMILCDETMPIMSGSELLRMIRAKSDVPFVLMSGYCAQAVFDACSANAFIKKPFKLVELQAVIENLKK